MKYALIGCGRIAVNHVKAAKDNDIEIAAVCDVKPEHMGDLLAKSNQNKAIPQFTDYSAMLAEIRPQLVAIATESGLHAEIGLACLDAGANVIIEKPMAMSIHEADRLIAKAKTTGLKVAVCHQNRFNLSVQRLRQAIERGRFGRLSHGSVHIRWSRRENYYSQAPWRGTWAQDGGCLMNQCIHGIDLLCWMMGSEAKAVYGQIRRQFHSYLETEDAGMAVIQFGNGVIATVEGTTNVYPENLEETLYVFGEKGTVKLGGKSCNTIEVWDFANDTEEDEESRGFSEQTINVYGNGHTSLYADMIDAIQNGHQPYVDAQAGKNALEIVLAIYKSYKLGEVIKIPLSEFSCSDMFGTFTPKMER